jgi:TetR/AcrR family transcriptional regulator of autoinduction and epiphytic fitness
MPPRRPAPTRRDRAQATRARMVDAARVLVLERGYSATTMADVAARAGVAVQTVYFSFGTKAALFTEVIVQLSGGGEARTPVMERAWVAEARAAAVPLRALALVVEHGTDIFARLLPVWQSIQAASEADADFAARFGDIVNARRNGMRAMLNDLARAGALAAGVTVERAADSLFLTQSPQLLALATTTLGWSVARFKAWTYTSLKPLFAGGAKRGAPTRGLSFHAEVGAVG